MPSLSVDQSARFARARPAVSLGAAYALLCTALLGYDARVSQAAGGLIEAVFGQLDPVPEIYYGSAPRYGVFRAPPRPPRAAKRPHDMQARRRLIERRRFAAHRPPHPVEQRPPVAVGMVPSRRDSLFRIRLIPHTAVAQQTERRVVSVPLGAGSPNRLGTAATAAPWRAAAPADFYADPTLRPGDTIVTSEGVRILRQGSHYPFKETDFVSLAQAGDAPLAKRSALNEIERVLKTPLGRSPADL